MENLYWLFGEMWTHPFMVRGATVTLVAAAVCAVISCWLILIGWSLMGDALSHAILPGVVIAYIAGVPFSVGALAAAIVAVLFIFLLRGTSRVKEDASMGAVFTAMFALGLILIKINPSNVDLNHVIFGDLLGITNSDMKQVLILAPLALVLLLVKRHDITAYAFDRTHLRAIGISTRAIGALLLVCLALTVVTAMQAVGAILIIALVIVPGAAAFLMTSKIQRMLWIAPVFACLCALGGLYVSYWFDLPSGASVVVAQGVVFLIIWVCSPHGLRGYLAGHISKPAITAAGKPAGTTPSKPADATETLEERETLEKRETETVASAGN
ncbi:metal ABC transporter permease [Actinobaculum suis]|uniref:metal ABC transporter permease n=1 Tax=Actinobaculum suis TaxID=1657 RepID=UPI0009E2FC5D|nr:metal ABC transporter permease [Actinobaculum suis]